MRGELREALPPEQDHALVAQEGHERVLVDVVRELGDARPHALAHRRSARQQER